MEAQTPEALTLPDLFGQIRQELKNSYNEIEALLLELVDVRRRPVEKIIVPLLDEDLQLQNGFPKMDDTALISVSDAGRVNFQAGFWQMLIPATGIFVENFFIQIGRLYDYWFSTGIILWEWYLLIFWPKREQGAVLLKWTEWKRRKKK